MAAILMYHGVTRTAPPVFDWCQVPAESFERQMAFLARHCQVLPLAELLDRLRAALPLPDRAVALTFDDGFRNVLTMAFPVLERYQFPATTFVVTGATESGQTPWPNLLFEAVCQTTHDSLVYNGRIYPMSSPRDRQAAYQRVVNQLKRLDAGRMDRELASLVAVLGGPPTVSGESPSATLSWAEIERLNKTGLMTFGSHTHKHPILSGCDPQRQEEELRVSRDLLREHLGSAGAFAYPNGQARDFTAETQRLVRELGYECGLTAIQGTLRASDDPYALCRIPVGPDTDFRLQPGEEVRASPVPG